MLWALGSPVPALGCSLPSKAEGVGGRMIPFSALSLVACQGFPGSWWQTLCLLLSCATPHLVPCPAARFFGVEHPVFWLEPLSVGISQGPLQRGVSGWLCLWRDKGSVPAGDISGLSGQLGWSLCDPLLQPSPQTHPATHPVSGEGTDPISSPTLLLCCVCLITSMRSFPY